MVNVALDHDRVLAAFGSARISSVIMTLARFGIFTALDGDRTLQQIAADTPGVDADRLEELIAVLVGAGVLRTRTSGQQRATSRISLEERILTGPNSPDALDDYLAGGSRRRWTDDFTMAYLEGSRLSPRSCRLISRFHGLGGPAPAPGLVVVSTAPDAWTTAAVSTADDVFEVPVVPGTGHLDGDLAQAAAACGPSPRDLVLHNVVHYSAIESLVRTLPADLFRSLLVVDVFVADDGENGEFVVDWLTHGGPCFQKRSDFVRFVDELGWRPQRAARLGLLDHMSFGRS